MSPVLLLPAGLSALVALALPLAIHLARRTEERPTVFAALRWLRPKPRPRRLPRLDERLLLAARLALLALLAVWLARPALQGAADRTAWVVVAAGVDPATARAAAGHGARARWLAPGFPDLKGAPPTASAPTMSLLRQFDAELPPGAPLNVLVPAEFDGADGERPRLSRRVDWRVAPGAPLALVRAPVMAAPDLDIRYAAGAGGGLRYLRAAAEAWRTPASPPVAVSQARDAPTSSSRVLVWLIPGATPMQVVDWVRAGGTALLASDATVGVPGLAEVVWRDASGRVLAQGSSFGRGRIVQFTRPLVPGSMPELVQPDFPDRLRDLLLPPPPAPRRARAQDVAPLTSGPAFPQPARDLSPWLSLAIAGLFLAERWLATRSKRAPAP